MIGLLSGSTISPVQFLLIFYSLLLSITDYAAFGYVYLVASAAILLLIKIYSVSVLSDWRKAVAIPGA